MKTSIHVCYACGRKWTAYGKEASVVCNRLCSIKCGASQNYGGVGKWRSGQEKSKSKVQD